LEHSNPDWLQVPLSDHYGVLVDLTLERPPTEEMMTEGLYTPFNN